MIEFEFGLLADHAYVDKSGGSKFYILGEFRYINAPTVPAQHERCVVAARWTADLVEVRDRQNTIQIEIVDEDANLVLPRAEAMPLNFGPIGPAEQSKAHAQLVVNIEGLLLPKYGAYSIHFIINGTHNGSVGFYLTQTSPT